MSTMVLQGFGPELRGRSTLMARSGMLIALLIVLIGQITYSNCQDSNVRYVLYDVNPGEGFNLRRDVFMRMAVFVKKLNQEKRGKFILVLPPWGRLYHWQTRELGQQVKIPWKRFFDVESIQRYVPAMEFEDFVEREGPLIDIVLYLQGYKEGWEGNFEYKYDYRDCISDQVPYTKASNEPFYSGWFWGYTEVKAKEFKCLSVQGPTHVIKDVILDSAKRVVMLDRGESLLHDHFGDVEYWMARRSMRFSPDLVRLADEFRQIKLDSSDAADNTLMSEKWEDHEPVREPRGGNYLCIHMRRKDYVFARKDFIPSVIGAAQQVRDKLKEKEIQAVFVATDAPLEEFEEFRRTLEDEFLVEKFQPSTEVLTEIQDGGVAIVDQIICSHARTFLGSPESTFTFRIQEEREIMGFELAENFNMLCPDHQPNCSKASQWKIAHPVRTTASLPSTPGNPVHSEL